MQCNVAAESCVAAGPVLNTRPEEGVRGEEQLKELHDGGGQGALLCPLPGDGGCQDVQVGAVVVWARVGRGGLCSLHQQGGEEGGGEMPGQWSLRQNHTVENVPPASVLGHLETVFTVSHLSLSTAPVFSLCLISSTDHIDHSILTCLNIQYY